MKKIIITLATDEKETIEKAIEEINSTLEYENIKAIAIEVK